MKRYKGYSLIEMIITIFIFGIVMLIATQTLTTLIRVSAVTKSKTISRSEADYVMELIDRFFTNSNVSDVYLYDSAEYRYFNEETGLISYQDDFLEGEDTPYDNPLQEAIAGNEIHFRPYGYNVWVCLGFFSNNDEESPKGYLVRRSVDNIDIDDHQSCFNFESGDGDNPLIILHSDNIYVSEFSIKYARSSTLNNIFFVDLEIEPIVWIPGGKEAIEKSVFRSAVITTRGLTWY